MRHDARVDDERSKLDEDELRRKSPTEGTASTRRPTSVVSSTPRANRSARAPVDGDAVARQREPGCSLPEQGQIGIREGISTRRPLQFALRPSNPITHLRRSATPADDDYCWV